MSFMQRLAATYLGFVVTIPSIAWWMEANGAAYPQNPAWQLISSLRYVCFASIATLVAVAMLAIGIAAFAELSERSSRERQVAKEKEEAALAAERYAARKKEEERREAEERKKKLIQEAEEKHAREEAIERELQKKRNRSSEAAVESALDEFG